MLKSIRESNGEHPKAQKSKLVVTLKNHVIGYIAAWRITIVVFLRDVLCLSADLERSRNESRHTRHLPGHNDGYKKQIEKTRENEG